MKRAFADIKAKRKAEKANNAPIREKSPAPSRKNVGVAAAWKMNQQWPSGSSSLHYTGTGQGATYPPTRKQPTTCQCDHHSLESTPSSSLGELEEIIYGRDEDLCQACFDAGGKSDVSS